MDLLATVLPRVRRFVPSAERGVSVALLGFLVCIEIAGYHATTEFHDALAGTALLAAGVIVVGCHRSRRLAWLDSLHDFFMRSCGRIEQLKYDIGVDFRGEPPLPRRVPRVIPALATFLLVAVGVAFAAWHAYPNGWRELGVRSSYVVYVFVLVVLWMLLLGAIAAGVMLPVMVLDQRLRAASGDRVQGPPDAVVVVGYALLTVLVACMAPPLYGAAGCGIAIVAGMLFSVLTPRDPSAVLWRTASGRGVHAMPLRRLGALLLVLGGLFVFTLIAWACGGRMMDSPSLDSGMPLTVFLGAVLAWLVPGLVLVMSYLWLDFKQNDPGSASQPVVHLANADATSLAAIRRWGFGVSTSPRTRDHVGLTLVSEAESQATEFQPEWPLAVCLKDLEGTLVKERVARRDELQLRRRFLKSLTNIVRKARKEAPSRGGGFLVAPHYWFITSVLWADPEHGPEADEESLKPLGPLYRQKLPIRARQYFHRMFRATEIDAIFLEDGIGPRKLQKVLQAALELYDIHGGRRRAEDHHFQGIPKIRVVIHEYAPGNPFHLEDYPEPRFDDVSRSRVLHIFRDRGESEALDESPYDFSWEPTPLTVA